MLHTKSQGHCSFGSREEYLRVFTLYGHGGHLGHVTINICYIFTLFNLRSLRMKFEINWPNGFLVNCFNILKGIRYERPWLKDQRLTWTFGTYL